MALHSRSKWETLSPPIMVHILFVWHRHQMLTNSLILKTRTRTISVIKPPPCLYRSPLLLLTVFGQHFFTHHPGFPCPTSTCPSSLSQLLFWPLSSWVSNFRTTRCWWKPCQQLAAQMRKNMMFCLLLFKKYFWFSKWLTALIRSLQLTPSGRKELLAPWLITKQHLQIAEHVPPHTALWCSLYVTVFSVSHLIQWGGTKSFKLEANDHYPHLSYSMPLAYGLLW